MTYCSNCKKELDDPDERELVEMELEYRKNFPGAWQEGETREVICGDCYELLNDIYPREDYGRE